MYEVEAKVRVKSEKEWLAILTKAKAIALFQKESLKKDVYFGKKDSSKALFRLRTIDQQKHEITIKNKTIENGMEKSQEDSFEIDNPFAFLLFTQKIGMKRILTKTKKSLIYQLENVVIELNTIENLGNFLEIEILCETEKETQTAYQKIIAVFQEFGYTKKDFEPLPYLKLIQTQN